MGKDFLLIAVIGAACAGAVFAYVKLRKEKTDAPEQAQEAEATQTDAVVEAKEDVQEEIHVMTEAKAEAAQAIIERHQRLEETMQELENPPEEIVESENTKLADQLLEQLDQMD